MKKGLFGDCGTGLFKKFSWVFEKKLIVLTNVKNLLIIY